MRIKKTNYLEAEGAVEKTAKCKQWGKIDRKIILEDFENRALQACSKRYILPPLPLVILVLKKKVEYFVHFKLYQISTLTSKS